jgi:thermostable 8-oxoguanine DNA glycosylase
VKLKTIDNSGDLHTAELLDNFEYQKFLTIKLDNFEGPFDQSVINEILLWKVNRYAQLDRVAENLINDINSKATKINEDQTREALKSLLKIKGIRLPVASTILRFKNPDIYQIIDQRVYRFLYGEEFKIPTNQEKQIESYLEYLKFLNEKCAEYGIPFRDSDRILYQADKELNTKKIKY